MRRSLSRILRSLILIAAAAGSPAFAGATRLTLLASAAQTATGNGAAFNVPNLKELACVVDCTAVSSGTTLDVFLQGSADGGTTFADLPASITLLDANTSGTEGAEDSASATTTTRNIIHLTTATGRAFASYYAFTDTVRVRWVLSGTSYTFSVRCVGK